MNPLGFTLDTEKGKAPMWLTCEQCSRTYLLGTKTSLASVLAVAEEHRC